MENNRLSELKEQIDALGIEIIKLLDKKFSMMKEVAEIKESERLPIRNRFIEEKLFDSIEKMPNIKFKDNIKNVMKNCLAQADMLQSSYIFGDKNVWLIGMPGCGKSTVGKYLSDYLCREFIDADDFFTSVMGMRPDICINSMGIDFFRDSETKILGILSQKNRCVISCGGGVVERIDNKALLQKNSNVIYIKRDLTKLATNGRPVSASVGVHALYDRRHEAYETWSNFAVNNNEIDECVKEIYNYLLEL